MKEIFDEYRWSILGGAGGFVLAVLFLTLGFFKTLLLLVLTLTGSYAGFYLKNSGFIDHYFSNKS